MAENEQEAAAGAEKDKEPAKAPNPMVGMLMSSVLTGGIVLGGSFYLMKAQSRELQALLGEEDVSAAEEGAEGHAEGASEGSGGGHGEKKSGGHGGATASGADNGFYDLDEFLVNLANPGGGRYLRTTLALSFKNEPMRDEIKKSQPRVRDAIVEVLTSKNTLDLGGKEGKTKLKEEILAALTKAMPKAGFDGVYIQAFTVQ